MKIITIEEHLAGAPINRCLAKYSAEDASYTSAAHGKGCPYDADPVLFSDLDKRRIEDMGFLSFYRVLISLCRRT